MRPGQESLQVLCSPKGNTLVIVSREAHRAQELCGSVRKRMLKMNQELPSRL